MLLIHYINLDSQTERRRLIEDNLRAHAGKAAWLRIPACETAYIQAEQVPGKISDSEKACFLSHAQAISQALAGDRHALILEDDSAIGPATCAMLDDIASRSDGDYDILFTSVDFLFLDRMIDLFFLKRKLDQSRAIHLLDLQDRPFSSASSYLVRRNAKAKIAGLVSRVREFDLPFDMWLRRMIDDGRIRAAVVFPFLTTLSPLSVESQIQPGAYRDQRAVCDSFRRLMTIPGLGDGANGGYLEDFALRKEVDPETERMARILRLGLAININGQHL